MVMFFYMYYTTELDLLQAKSKDIRVNGNMLPLKSKIIRVILAVQRTDKTSDRAEEGRYLYCVEEPYYILTLTAVMQL